MTITVNDKPHQTSEDITIAQLLAELGYGRDGVAVAIDEKVVPLSQWETQTLYEGVSLIIIQAVSGG